MGRLTDKDCWKYEDFVFNYRNRETMQSGTDFAMYVKLKSLEDLEEEIGVEDGTYDHKELIVYDKDTKNEINTTIYEITEVEVE